MPRARREVEEAVEVAKEAAEEMVTAGEDRTRDRASKISRRPTNNLSASTTS